MCAFHFKPKIAKSQQPDKTPYTIFTAQRNRQSLAFRKWAEPYIQLVSIDPVKQNLGNFAIRIERRFNNGLIIPLVFTKLIKHQKENKKDEEEEEQEKSKPRTKKDLTQPDPICDIYDQLTEFLNQYLELIRESHIIIVERQVPFNYKAVRVSQHVLTYFFTVMKQSKTVDPVILEIDPQLKTRELGAPKGLNERQVKQWSVEKGTELLQMRGDTESLATLERYKTMKKATVSQKKLDDLCDTVCQIEALCSYLEFPITQKSVVIDLSN
jgi:hypothetical protein